MARPKFSATPEQRKIVEAMMGYGVPEAGIAKTLGIDAKTLRKHFRHELDLGAIKANTAVAQSAFRMATSGKCPVMSIFWLKCRAGWRETTILQHTGPGGGAVEISDADIEKRIADELARLAAKRELAPVPAVVNAPREVDLGAPMAGMEGAAPPTGSGG